MASPAMASTRLCPFFKHGLCLLGDTCVLAHDDPAPRDRAAPSAPPASSVAAPPTQVPPSPPRRETALRPRAAAPVVIPRQPHLGARPKTAAATAAQPVARAPLGTTESLLHKMESMYRGLEQEGEEGWAPKSPDRNTAPTPICSYPVPDILQRSRDNSIVMQQQQQQELRNLALMQQLQQQQQQEHLEGAFSPSSSCPPFGRGRSLFRPPLRRPGRTAFETLSNRFFCHQCKQDLPYVNPGMICPFCLGDFIEESCSVDRTANQQETAKEGNQNRPEPSQYNQQERADLGMKYASEEGDGFAWVPPSQLYQSFLSRENKLVALESNNPYVYLTEEDAVDGDFPHLPDSPEETCAVDERILARELRRQKERRISAATTTTNSGSADFNDWDDSGGSSEDEDQSAGQDQNGKIRTSTKAQRKRLRRKARRLLLQMKKQEDKEAQEKAEAEKKRKEAEAREKKVKERLMREKARQEMERASWMMRRSIAQSLQTDIN